MKTTRHLPLGVFLISMGALALEVVLTRIFSVTMWYHFAFLAISMALVGSAMAGVLLYFFPGFTQPDMAQKWIGRASVALAVAVPIIFLLYLEIPFRPVLMNRDGGFSFVQLGWLALIYVLLSIPFFLSGSVLALMLAGWSNEAGKVYAADLIGAALGCLVSVTALAFMLVEIPTMQKLTVYLGQPVYSLAVVLFSLLLFSGLGSWWSRRWAGGRIAANMRRVFPVLVIFLVLHALFSSAILEQTLRLGLAARLAVAVLLLSVLGFLMGIPFPVGIRWVGRQRHYLCTWLSPGNGAVDPRWLSPDAGRGHAGLWHGGDAILLRRAPERAGNGRDRAAAAGRTGHAGARTGLIWN